ncbi:MAG TPA: glycoside hydrolase family 3 C-terminal domain-containing protein [Streptosporangiaceae bacterium]|nr:glycoside hydrolase family 3 C-terminal domain-containing protein [Streptosporangiaceae bacterium]
MAGRSAVGAGLAGRDGEVQHPVAAQPAQDLHGQVRELVSQPHRVIPRVEDHQDRQVTVTPVLRLDQPGDDLPDLGGGHLGLVIIRAQADGVQHRGPRGAAGLQRRDHRVRPARDHLRLPGRQSELLEVLLGTGTPVVLVLLTGRPYELSRFVGRLAAAVCGFFPGQEGGRALAGVLSGRVNPSGRLPVSFPATGATQPGGYLAPAPALRSDVSTVDPTPAFPFGHGLSYAPATWCSVVLRSPHAWPTDGYCQVSITLRNDAAITTTEVIQVYLHDPVAEVARPVQQLIATARADLAAGQSRTVVIDLHADLTSYTGRAGRRQVEPGEAELRIGASSTDIRAVLPVTLTGPRRPAGYDRILYPVVTLLPPE